MSRKRNNPDDQKLPPRVYKTKYCFYYKPTTRESLSLGPVSMGMAELWDRYEKVRLGRQNITTFNALWDHFVKSPFFTELKPRTQRDYLQHQRKLLSVFGKMKADSVKPEHVRTFMDRRGQQSKIQANHEMSSMSRVYRWGYERGYVKKNPCEGVTKFKIIARDRYITDEEYAAVALKAPLPLFVAMEIAYLCAARVADVLALTWDQIRVEGIYIKQGKNGAKQIKAWTDRLHHAIELMRPMRLLSPFVIVSSRGTRFSYNGFNDMWRQAREDAGVRLGRELDFTFHDLKAKGISDYEGSSRDKQLFSGHKTESQVLVYDRKTAVTPSLDRPILALRK